MQNLQNPTEWAEQFWTFSCAHYAEEGVAQCCLQLQDQQQLNVNCILLGIWLQQHHMLLSKSAWQQLHHAITQWQQQVIQPVRAARRASKHFTAIAENQLQPLRQQLQQVELLLEQQEQRLLLETLGRVLNQATNVPPISTENFFHYLHSQGIEDTARFQTQAQQLYHGLIHARST